MSSVSVNVLFCAHPYRRVLCYLALHNAQEQTHAESNHQINQIKLIINSTHIVNAGWNEY